MRYFEKYEFPARALQIAAFLNSLAVLYILSLYAYGGLFSRYQADDYCEAVILFNAAHVFDAVISSYQKWLNSYSILIVLQVVEWLGEWGIRWLAGGTILLWVSGLTWLFSEIGKAARFHLGFWVNFWLAGLVVFLSLYQAPNIHQILYWRAAMVPYTMPLFFFVYIAAMLLRYARLPYQKDRSMLVGALSAFLVFFTAGLGETTAAMQVGLFFSAVSVSWLTNLRQRRADVWNILLISFLISVVSLVIIALSPGTSIRLGRLATQTPPVYNPILLGIRTSGYVFLFLLDTFKAFPLPLFFSFVIPFALMYLQVLNVEKGALRFSASRLRIAALMILLFIFIVIGFSFAPSAFAQSYPVARARFAAHFILTLGALLEGALLGMLAAGFRLPIRQNFARSVLLLLLGLALIYPLYASTKLRDPMEVFQRWAAQWDERDAYIRQMVAEGATDLEVEQLDTIGGVQEYKHDPNHWVNKCAAEFYGLQSLRAP